MRRLRRAEGEDGIVMIITALLTAVFVMAASFAIDIGFRAEHKREADLVADLAALDAVRDLSSAANTLAAATASVKRNGLDPSLPGNSLTAVRGHVVNGAFVGEGTTPCPCDAVQVTAANTYHDLFSPNSGILSATSVATAGSTSTDLGQFQIGSALLSISTAQSAVLNSLLSPFGISSNLTAVGYTGLISDTTTLGVLASQLSLSALTPDQVLTSQVTVAQLVNAYANILPAGGTSQLQLVALFTLLNGSSFNSLHPVTLGAALGLQAGTGVGFGAAFDMFHTLVGSIELADGSAAINIPSLSLTLGAVTVVAGVKAIVPAAPSGYGPATQTATDTQVTVTLDITIGNIPLLGNILSVHLPITVTAGGATGTMTQVQCPALPLNTPIGLLVNTTFAPVAVVVAGTAHVTVLSGLGGGADLTGGASVTGTPVNGTQLSYSPATNPLNFWANSSPAGQNVPVHVGAASDVVPPPTLSVSNPTGLVGGLLMPISAVLTAVTNAVASALTSISTNVVTPLLSALGAHIGAADLLGRYANCGLPTVVQ